MTIGRQRWIEKREGGARQTEVDREES
jgi:hypothetical protein